MCVRLLALEPEREEVHRLKMRLLALAGQRGAALKQYDECTSALLNELGVPPSTETTALYDQVLAGELGSSGASPSTMLHQTPYQGPAAPLHFVGRTRESELISAWLAQRESGPIVAVVGMGGIGKTALAAQVASRLRSEFPDGILWARVATDDVLDILQSWAVAFDKDLSKIGSREARAAAMRNILAEKRVLIVLDDAVAGSPIELLLPGTARSAVLVTTRDRAEVAALTSASVELSELEPEEGVAMLAGILGEESVAGDHAEAAMLCSTLGNLPLAVEIAAQRLLASPRRSLARMLRSLQDERERLAHGISNRSVRTSFNVSWEALSPVHRRIFALTGVFDGRSFPAPALAAMIEEDADLCAEQLDHLVTLSMLKLEGTERYVQHRLLADFAREKLAGDQHLNASRLRLVAYWSMFAKQRATNYDALEPDWDNLLASIQLAAELQAWSLVVETIDALAAPWFARARLTHALDGFRLGMSAAAALGDGARRARYAYFMGKILLRQDEYATARSLLDMAISDFRIQQDRPRLADAYVGLADVAIEQGQFDEASSYLAEAQVQYIDLGQPIGLAMVKCRQALVAYFRHEDSEARRLCIEGLACLPEGDGAIVRCARCAC